MITTLQVRMLIHKDREGYVGMKKEPYSRISMALKYRIKEFVTHPNCQQVNHLSSSPACLSLPSLSIGFAGTCKM